MIKLLLKEELKKKILEVAYIHTSEIYEEEKTKRLVDIIKLAPIRKDILLIHSERLMN